MKNFLLAVLSIVFIGLNFSFAGNQGCCSWHGGLSYCAANGRWVCKDGTYSPSCTCSTSSNSYYNTYSNNYFNSYTVKKSCFEIYGIGAMENYDGTCSCMAGYVWGTNILGKTACITEDQACKDQFGISAKSIGNKQCGCNYGYIMKNNKCVDEMSEKVKECNTIRNSTFDYVTKTCYCKAGYIFDGINCITETESCQKTYGINSIAGDPGYCKCKSGYEWSLDGKSCILKSTYTNTNNTYTNNTYSNDFADYIKMLLDQEDEINEATDDGEIYINGLSATPKLSEMEEAVQWMYNAGMTRFNEPNSFMATKSLRRDEASKFFVRFAKDILGKTPDTSKDCKFSDLDKAWSDLKGEIVEACQLGLFQGAKGKFMPEQQLTNAQAITVFMRMFEGYKDESGTHFANEYYTSAHDKGFLKDTPLDYMTNFGNETTRGDVAKMLFRGMNSTL